MAKKITNTEESQESISESSNQELEKKIEQEVPIIPAISGLVEDKLSKQKVNQAEDFKIIKNVADEYTQGLLRLYYAYEFLYIDKHGGVFNPKTPESMRKGATLYKNPYYKPQPE